MKTFIFSALALGMMASCSNTEVEGIDVVDNGEPVAIQVTAGVKTNVAAGVTRAPLTSGTFDATILGWEGTDTPEYSTVTPWIVTGKDINVVGSTTVILDKYYNTSNGTKTYMKACYPVGTVTEGVYNFTGIKEDGSVDVLYAGEISGSRAAAPVTGFVFNHMLTQVKFSIKAGDGLLNGTKLKSITLNAPQVATGINLKSNALVTKAPSTPISVTIADGGIEIPDVATPIANSELMIAPTTEKTMSLTVVTNDGTSDKTFDNVVVTVDDSEFFAAGTAYTVTLTFKEKISVETTVTAWKTGTASGTVE